MASITQIGAFHERQLQEQFVLESFMNHQPLQQKQLPEYLGILNFVSDGNRLKRTLIQSAQRTLCDTHTIQGRADTISVAADLRQTAERTAMEERKYQSLTKQVRQKQKRLACLRQETTVLQQRLSAHARQQSRVQSIEQAAAEQLKSVQLERWKVGRATSSVGFQQKILVQQLQQISTVSKLTLTKEKKRLFFQLNKKKVQNAFTQKCMQRMRSFQQLKRLHSSEERSLQRVSHSKNSLAFLSEVLGSLYKFITNQENVALFRLPNSLGSSTIQRNSSEIYTSLFNHRKSYMHNLEIIKDRKLLKRVSSVKGQPKSEVLASLIIEAHEDIEKRLEHLKQLYKDRLDKIKRCRETLNRLSQTLSNCSRQCPLKMREPDDAANAVRQMAQWKSATIRHLGLVAQLLRGLAEIQRQGYTLEKSRLYCDMAKIRMGDAFPQGFFEALPSSTMGLIRQIMYPSKRLIMLKPHQHEYEEFNQSRSSLGDSAYSKAKVDPRNIRSQNVQSANISDDAIEERQFETEKELTVTKLPQHAEESEIHRQEFADKLRRDYVTMSKKTSQFERNHRCLTRDFKRRLRLQSSEDMSILMRQHRQDQSRFAGIVRSFKIRSKQLLEKRQRVNTTFSKTASQYGADTKKSICRSVYRFQSREESIREQAPVNRCKSYQAIA